MTGPALVVSIHDVSPRTAEAVVAMLADLESVGVPRTSLLVIPDHHGLAPLDQHPEFAAWLKTLAEQHGHEIVLHGYAHRRAPKASESLKDRVTTGIYTAGEGEFYDLDQPAASEAIKRGLEMFRALGLPAPSGFIAPAWLLGAEAEMAVRALGFDYTTRLTEVLRFHDNRRWNSQSLVYSTRAAWRRWVSLAWNASLFRRLRPNPLMRLGLHPPDWLHHRIRGQALRLAQTAVEAGRSPMTYAEWVSGG